LSLLPTKVKETNTLYQNLLNDSSLYKFLLKLDEDLAAQCRKAGCFCGGCLHSAIYPRKPRGNPSDVEDGCNWRYSFCCARDGCRRRHTPPSFRFLGRKVYMGAVFVLISAMRNGATPKRMAQLRELVGVSRRTVERWRKWWLKDFVRSSFWKEIRARLRAPVDQSALPLSLLTSFIDRCEKEQLIDFLRFILPLTVPGLMQGFSWPAPTRRRCLSR
jgi:hypothetical protein